MDIEDFSGVWGKDHAEKFATVVINLNNALDARGFSEDFRTKVICSVLKGSIQ